MFCGAGLRPDWPTVPTRSALRRELDGDLFEAVDEVRAQPPDGAGQPHVGQPPQDLLEHDPDLEPRQARAQAEVLADAESQMLVRTARDVELLRILEHRFVAVCARVVNDDLVALGNPLA